MIIQMRRLTALLAIISLVLLFLLQGCIQSERNQSFNASAGTADDLIDSITIQVLYEDGSPAGGTCIVSTAWYDPTKEVAVYSSTDESGKAVITQVCPGSHPLSIWPAEGGPAIENEEQRLLVDDSIKDYVVYATREDC